MEVKRRCRMKLTKRIIILLLTATFSLAFNIQPVKAFDESEYIVIAGGTYTPNTAPISQEGKVYTFTDNIQCRGIKVKDNDIIIDGDGYTLRSTSGYRATEEIGIWLAGDVNPSSNITGVTIKNLFISSFNIGIFLPLNTRNNEIYRNTIYDCQIGVDIQFNTSSCNNKFYHNNFIFNTEQVTLNDLIGGCDCDNTWDDDDDYYLSGGNYWTDHEYNCPDSLCDPNQTTDGRDGICDNQYDVDGDPNTNNNIDRFPLVYQYQRAVQNISTGLDYYTIQEAVDAARPGDTIRVPGHLGLYPEIYSGLYVDLDRSGTVDLPDLCILVQYWLVGTEEPPGVECDSLYWCDGADLDRDGDVDNSDFAIMYDYWLSKWEPTPSYYENLELNKSLSLIGEGAGTTVIDGIRKQSTEEMEGDNVVDITANKIHLEGFTVQNAGSGKCGLDLNAARLNYIIGNTITDNTNGVRLYNGADYNTIVDSDIDNNTGTGIDISDSNSILISKTNITGNADFGIQISNSGNTRIVKNILGSNNGGISIRGNCRDNNIRGNDILSSLNNFNGIVVGNSGDAFLPSGIAIASNEITSSYNGIELYGTSNSAISDNVLQGNYNCGLYGLLLGNDSNNVIENNVVQSNNEHGIYLECSNNILITGNGIFGNGVDGIHLEDSNDISITGNRLYSNTQDGIDLANSICDIMRNIVTDNNDIGIRLNSSDNTVTYNSIMDNNFGISVGGANNKIHHNVFVNGLGEHLNNAEAKSLPNTWNSNEPNLIIGNFWSDYLHDDKCPDAEQVEGSIVWNEWYPITVDGSRDPNNMDHAPVVLVSYNITKPDKPKMNKKYKLELELTNNWDVFDPCDPCDVKFAGLYQTEPAEPGSWLDWIPGVEDFNWWPNPHWTLGFEYYSDYIFPESSRTIPAAKGPNNPRDFDLYFRNEWNWIEPGDWDGVVLDLICAIPYVKGGTQVSIARFVQACYNAALAVPSVKYNFDRIPPPDSSPFIILKTDVTAKVPWYKAGALYGSIGAQIAAIKLATLAAPLLLCPLTAPAGAALAAKSAACTIASIVAYKVAEDPNPNYLEVFFEPNSITVAEVESIDDADPNNAGPKQLALAALELASLEYAYGQSCIRYDYAKIADNGEPNDFYMALQLGAAAKYNAMAARKAQEVEVLSAIVTSEPNVADRIADIVTDYYVANFNLTGHQEDIFKEVLAQLDLEPNAPTLDDIKDVIETAIAIPQLRQQHFNNNIDGLDKHMHIMTQTHHIQDYALLDEIETEGLMALYQVHYMHDVAITALWPSVVKVDRAEQAYIEEKVYINVEVENLGTAAETFDVKLYANRNFGEPNFLGTKQVSGLAPGEKKTLTFTWNTADVPVTDYYRIKAEIISADDSFLANNVYTTAGIVTVLVPPDVPPLSSPSTTHSVAATTVTLQWNPVGQAFGYKVYRNGGLNPIWQGWAIPTTGVISYTDTGLATGTYTYQVTAYDKFQNESEPSTEEPVIIE